MKRISLLFVLMIIQCTQWIGAQSFKVVKDPLGNEITIKEDSSHIFNAFDYLMAFTINQEDDTRNVLVFNGDTSFWLFNQGFEKHLTVTPFTRTEKFGFPGNFVWFSIGGIWYETKGTPSTTKVFNDNSNPDSTYQYIQLFNFKTGDLGIEAIEKNSGDTLVLFYNPTTKQYQIFKDEFGNPIKVIKVAEPFGFGESKDFVGAQFNPLTLEYDFYGLYSWSTGNLTQILELGKRLTYDLEFVYKDNISYQYIIDKISSDSATVYQYNNSTGNFDDVSSTVINGYEVIDAYNLPSVYYDKDLNDEHSFTESIWKCKVLPLGAIRYIFRSAFGANVEINNLRDQPNAAFMYASFDDDSIYYYNYAQTIRGLFRFNTLNKAFAFDPTSIQFSQDFQIRGWKGKMYFGRYDQTTGKIVATLKNFDDDSYSFIESFNGDKVEQPIDYSFLDDRVFIHSKQDEGIKLIYFDPTPIVATKDLKDNDLGIILSPNPTRGIINISLPDSGLKWKNYFIYDSHGTTISKGELSSHRIVINLMNHSAGIYYISFVTDNNVVTKSFSIAY
jgi:hypothetical protein